ncbi:glutamate--cysteine ligase EgtA [Actinoplanes sp. NBRC 14428]|uniref:Glutamate--cysteine ligase EgtA n=1 Tax=Pseudosporangium ferrugineum TaxID=439699 RepID=A0A2T0S4A0_9ACTN|nr:ergothioneine biosynthesis glutamate--cysteine ligase EgtA [Pseudosporangium ferrugineum]PRY28257.1 glutamate--cysteine ligase [Pseudosporangium ferrugineum]BCJ54117.1 glutamate--cysteine ligase EgtA [Actinoplanes sp. NBRC 14428]
MTTKSSDEDPAGRILRHASEAAEHVSGICFKTGPPGRVGVELEWTTHRAGEPAAHLRPTALRRALGPHAPTALGNRDPVPLPGGGTVTLEPGGQVEISSAPADSLVTLYAAVTADHARLADLLARSGLGLGEHGLDAHRPPVRILDTPRYAAMESAFARAGEPSGRTMMCSTAGLQICLDAGTEARAPARWAAVHELGPPLLALFANSSRHAGRDTGWASGRMAAWHGIDPRRSGPVAAGPDPAESWARYVLTAPLLCVRRGDGRWDAPEGVTFADWIGGALPVPPTVDDLEYHISTLFPPVRPRGYLEVRYLDAQPGGEWIAPVAVLCTLLADDALTDAARDLVAPAAGRWQQAARDGLADPVVAACAADVADLACRHLDRTGLPGRVRALVAGIVDRRLRHADLRSEDLIR